jgi:hypothetical protein
MKIIPLGLPMIESSEESPVARSATATTAGYALKSVATEGSLLPTAGPMATPPNRNVASSRYPDDNDCLR